MADSAEKSSMTPVQQIRAPRDFIFRISLTMSAFLSFKNGIYPRKGANKFRYFHDIMKLPGAIAAGLSPPDWQELTRGEPAAWQAQA
jgi:hypothetical protein